MRYNGKKGCLPKQTPKVQEEYSTKKLERQSNSDISEKSPKNNAEKNIKKI